MPGAALSRSFQLPEKSKGFGVGRDFLGMISYAMKVLSLSYNDHLNIDNACIRNAEVEYLTEKIPVHNFTLIERWKEWIGSSGERLMNDKQARQSSMEQQILQPDLAIGGDDRLFPSLLPLKLKWSTARVISTMARIHPIAIPSDSPSNICLKFIRAPVITKYSYLQHRRRLGQASGQENRGQVAGVEYGMSR